MLRDFVQTRLDAVQLGDLLTMAGFELEGIEEVDGDSVLDIKVMSNRGDGLSVFGLAREVLAKDVASNATNLYQRAAGFFEGDVESPGFAIPDSSAEIQSEECLRFACRAYDNVDAAGQSPEWMQRRLAQAGMRPISILVDLTNYVMLELGQPLHAFDREKLAEQRIVVRHAKPGEKLTTLNGLEHELDGQMMICDALKPVGVPGVMGGLETEVTDGTTKLLLESANFRHTTVRKTRKQLGLNTEASYRFERCVDPNGVVRAIERFTQLLIESQARVSYSNIVDLYPGRDEWGPVALRLERANRLLGMTIGADAAEGYLRNLGFDLSVSHDPVTTFQVVPPSWRPDIVREIDLVEELGRVHGYERIPNELPIGQTPVGGPKGHLFRVDLIREAMVRAGFIQVMSHSLRDLHPLDALGERIGPKNPGSPEMAWLRNSNLPCLAEAAIRNGGKDVHLFEIGKVFTSTLEYRSLGVLSTGSLQPAHWRKSESVAADFYSLKGTIKSAFQSVEIPLEFRPRCAEDPRLHPTRSADIMLGGQNLGWLAQIHPNVAEAVGLSEETILAEVNLDALESGTVQDIAYKPLSRNPSVRRDISIEISKSTAFDSVERALRQACGDVLERQWLFDVYEGKGIAVGNHSLSVALQFRKHGGNFTDEEANQVRERAVAALVELGAKPR